jgi:hypothetical protein
MSAESALAGAYLAKGIIGNTGTPGAPVVQFALVVVPGNHKVSGSVQVTQAVQNGNYQGQVQGTIYATGFGEVTQVVAFQGSIHPDGPQPIEIPFEAHLSIGADWRGKGGFSYANVHVENVPVKPL